MSKITVKDYDRLAMILVEAAFFGDVKAADRWGITKRTIQRYKVKASEDEKLSSFVAIKKAQFEQEWATEIPGAIRAGIHFLGEAARQADPSNPDHIHAVAGAVKILAEVGLTKEILDAKLSRFIVQDRTQDR